MRLVNVMMVVFDAEPAITLREDGLELMLKAGMMTVAITVVMFVVELLAPLTVTV